MNAGGTDWRNPQRLKVIAVALVMGLFLFMELVLHFYLGIDIIYTHFFYIFLILTGMWYHRKAVFAGCALGALHIGIEYITTGAIAPGVVVRAAMFILVAYLSGYLFEKIAEEQNRFMAYVVDTVGQIQVCSYPARSSLKLRGESRNDIARMQRDGDIGGLIAYLYAKNPEIRYCAAAALGDTGDHRAVEPLAGMLGNEETSVRWKAAEALSRLGEPALDALIRSLKDESVDVRWMAAIALGDTGDLRAVRPLIERLSDEEDRYVWSRAALALGRIGAPALDALIHALQTGEEQVRQGAALALGKIPEPAAIEALVGALDDRCGDIRLQATGALGEIGEPAVRPLITAMCGADRDRREMIAEALVSIGRPAIEPLLDAISHDDWTVRAGAATALGKMGDESAVPAITGMLDDMHEEVRTAAHNALKAG